MAGAAIFDLDRTLLAGASGAVYSAAMRDTGFATRSIPGEKLVYGLFNLIGETLPSMALARQAATFAKGRLRDAMRQAGEAATGPLAATVQPFAFPLFAEHRAAGRKLVMATTTPYDLVKPLADWLGFDALLATRYGVNADGTFDGSLVGPFVWARGKLAAVKAWAEENGIDLGESYAYSDSVFDSPLLSAVGHPVAVNPDPGMVVMATLRRWPIHNLDVPKGVVKIPVLGMELQTDREPAHPARDRPVPDAVRALRHRRARERPGQGPGDRRVQPPQLLRRRRRRHDHRSHRPVGRFLGKKEVFDAPVIGQLASAVGGIRVERASGSAEPLHAAAEALEAGELVMIAPQGTIPRGPAFFEPELKGRWGAARLHQMTGAPVVPLGLWGTEKVWPRSSRLPNVLNVTNRPTVRVRVGSPVKGLKAKSLDADTKKIMKAIVDQLPPEARRQHTPTDAELMATFPPGYTGDPAAESERRPGTDS